jgi:chemotaxis protein methyltransferase CheR
MPERTLTSEMSSVFGTMFLALGIEIHAVALSILARCCYRKMVAERVCTDKDFIALKKQIFRSTSLDMGQYKDTYLQRRFGVRMRVCASKTYADYIAFLETNPKEYDQLLDDLTINVTQFFRDPIVFKAMEEEVLPLLIYEKVKQNKNDITIWSAGCSSGEEPYSIAIMLRELLGEELDNFNVNIIGSDIDDFSLDAAATGKYLPRQVTNVKKEYLQKYFKLDGETYQISQDIMDMVDFRKIDLIAAKPPARFDCIFCRNVVIYFTREMQEHLYMKFFGSLNQGGYFVMGNTETLVGEAAHLLTTFKSRERIYQKAVPA